LYNNYAGNYLNCTSNTDIYVDPLLVNQRIGAGYNVSSDPTRELLKNGEQIDIKSIRKQSYS
jgi:hypothetical protein